ncbi:MAG: cupin domain-containing protein [Alphaproteobacteria bacterium]|nr:cupin domain-containing protein [Alphaproteobacteria bacterium]
MAFSKTKTRACLAALAGMMCLAPLALAQDANAPVWYAWSPKPDVLPAYGDNRPVTRLPAVLAKHRGQKRWSEQVIATKRYDAKWIQAQPGDKSPNMYWADDRIFWVVWGGQIRFSIDGQQPFIASKGFLVQVPQRTRYAMETVGDGPSLRFEVTHAGIPPLYSGDQPRPANVPGAHYMKISTPTAPEGYDELNRPYVDFLKDVVAADPLHAPKRHFVVHDEANLVNIIRGMGVPTPPDSNRGHFHIGDDEFWFILEGRCDFLIEDTGLVTADAGDIVFVPPGRFHRASWALGKDGKPAMATRLSFNVSPLLFHNFAADAAGRQ